MFAVWLESLKKIPLIPTVIERNTVLKARKAVVQPLINTSISQESTIWVDISVISRRDAGSGIQRVVRALLAELQGASIPGWRIQPVAATPRQPYRLASWDIPTVNPENYSKLEPQSGDVFLGLDLSAHIIPRHQRQMAEWKLRGVKVAIVIYDLLPLQYPRWFSAKLVCAFRRWIKSVAILADQVFCISQTVKRDFEDFIQIQYCLPEGTIPAHVFPLGANIKGSQPSFGLPEGFAEKMGAIRHDQAALMVGTVEPRKGHGQILDAFELLWNKGCMHKLVIVGRPGWMTEGLQRRIMTNQHLNCRLFWFDNVSDEALCALYEECTGVINASFAEGYGLPILEAIGYQKPVLARNLAVFHQFNSPLINFFPKDCDAETISTSIDRWLKICASRPLQGKNAYQFKLPTWRVSKNVILSKLLSPD